MFQNGVFDKLTSFILISQLILHAVKRRQNYFSVRDILDIMLQINLLYFNSNCFCLHTHTFLDTHTPVRATELMQTRCTHTHSIGKTKTQAKTLLGLLWTLCCYGIGTYECL